MFEALKKNLEHEKKIIMDMSSIQISMQNDSSNKGFYISSLKALTEQLVLLNNAIPELLKEQSPIAEFNKDNDKAIIKVSAIMIRPFLCWAIGILWMLQTRLHA